MGYTVYQVTPAAGDFFFTIRSNPSLNWGWFLREKMTSWWGNKISSSFFSSPFFPFYVSLNWFQQWRQSSAAVFQIASHCIVFLGNSEDFWSIFDLFTSFRTILGYVNVTTCHHFTSRIQVSRHLDRSVFTCLVLGFWKDQHQPVVEPVVDDCPNWSNIPMV